MASSSSKSTAAIVTRKKTEVWLIGQMSAALNQTVLPTTKNVMSLFFHYKDIEKLSIKNAYHSTAEDVLDIWEKARIPVRLKNTSWQKDFYGMEEFLKK